MKWAELDEARLQRMKTEKIQFRYEDPRFIKKITKPMMGFKAFHSAQATIAGIETT
jgi:transposase-like protein